MRGLLWLLAVSVAAVAIVLVGRLDASYVIFVFPSHRVELRLLGFVLAAAAAFVLLYGAVRLLGQAFSLPAHVRAFRARRRRELAHGAFASALQAYYEGRYARAEKEAAAVFEAGSTPGLAALLAARAAHQMREFGRRDRWLERAESAPHDPQAARLVTRAEFALDERDFPAAREALRSLQDMGPRHIAALRMLLRAERGAGAWHEVLRLATQLAKRDAIAPALAEEHKVQAMVELLRAAPDAGSFERLWRGIAAADQAKPRIAASGARQATACGKAKLAREILERALAQEWAPPLVSLYAELPGELEGVARAEEARVRIESAERWLRSHNRDPELLATLGRLCAAAELWGKARSFLEASLSFEESRAARLELARLAERLGQADDAQRHFRKAAELP